MSVVHTIGYEGAAIEDFIRVLQASRINLLVDVRDLPLSRKKGFSKNSLRDHLATAGISYLHLPALGDPKPGREAARRGEYPLFRKIYARQLATVEAQHSLQTLAKLAETQIVCLMCFERLHETCHRAIIAHSLIEDYGHRFKHLVVTQEAGTDGGRAVRKQFRAAVG